MSDKDRVAREWLERYGDPIDCEELAREAAPAHLEALRFDVAARRMAARLADLLDSQEAERLSLLAERVPGTSESIESYYARGDGSLSLRAPSPFHIAAVLAEHSSLSEKHIGLLRSIASSTDWPIGRGGKTLPDFALGYVCDFLAGWIRERRLDGKTSWCDIVECLKWHGHELLTWDDEAGCALRAAGRYRLARERALRTDLESG